MFKEPKLKANHNNLDCIYLILLSIYQCSKNRNWKQITTDTPNPYETLKVFINVQRTEIESKSQHKLISLSIFNSIYQCSKNRNWKQITTITSLIDLTSIVFINVQRTEIESKSQPIQIIMQSKLKYLSMFKEPKLKANHNINITYLINSRSIYQCSKNRNWKQITTF